MPAADLPDGVVVREIREADASALLDLQRALDDESSMMMLEPGERTATTQEIRDRLRGIARTANSTILVAAHGEGLVGYVEATGGPYRRTLHSAYVVIGIRRAWQGRGLGRALLDALERWASEHGVTRLELTVRVDNEPAKRLYERAGYVTEGVRRWSLRHGDEMVDELAMARLLVPGSE